MKEFSVFLGLDQTGAIKGKGPNAKPLPLCIAFQDEKNHWKFVTQSNNRPLVLENFSLKTIQNTLKSLGLISCWSDIAIVVDCVLGLPQSVWQSRLGEGQTLWDLFFKAASFQKSGKQFGRQVAEAFFQELWSNPSKDVPRRTCELLSGSNSVFQVSPYQKNIQTGTYRFWKELGQSGQSWVHIWPFDEVSTQQSHQPWLFEGYPSLFWRQELQLRSRDPKKLSQAAKAVGWKMEVDTWRVVEASKDHADAFVLAYGAINMQNRSQLFCSLKHLIEPQVLHQEGWILGLKED